MLVSLKAFAFVAAVLAAPGFAQSDHESVIGDGDQPAAANSGAYAPPAYTPPAYTPPAFTPPHENGDGQHQYQHDPSAGHGDGEHQHQHGDGKGQHQHGDGKGGNPFADSVPSASTARWLMEQSTWGTVNTIGKNPLMKDDDNDSLVSNTLPFAVSSSEKGRIFLYLMGESHLHGASLTISQAALNSELFAKSACGSADSAVDPQDPRCGKLTVQGSIHPCNDQLVGANCDEVGRAALFEKHPSMKDWPEDHDFQVHEFIITEDIWMIANFGGGTPVTPADYANAASVEHKIKGGDKISVSAAKEAVPPAWYRHPVRARWIVHHSHWATISTLSIDEKDDEGKDMPFGNIRSIVDGMDWESSAGTPIFYLPDVDPTAVDMKKHGGQIVLTFSEAGLAERVSADGSVCSGQEVGNPTCGQVTLYGTVVEYKSTNYEKLFKKFHPLAEWLAEGGSHMSGSYYTIEINRIMILDFFGGFHEVPVEAYLNVDTSKAGVSMKKDISVSSILVAIGFLVGCCCGVKFKPSFLSGKDDTNYGQLKDLSLTTEGESDGSGSIEMDHFKDEEEPEMDHFKDEVEQ